MYIPAVSGGQNAPYLQTYQPEQTEVPDFSSGYAPYYHDKKPSGIDPVEAVRVMAHLIPGMTEIPPEGKRKLMDTLLRYGQEQRENQIKERNTHVINTYVRPMLEGGGASAGAVLLGTAGSIAPGPGTVAGGALGAGVGYAAGAQASDILLELFGNPAQYNIPGGRYGKMVNDVAKGATLEIGAPYAVVGAVKAGTLVGKPLGAAGKRAIGAAGQFLKKMKGKAGSTAAESEAAAPVLSAADDLLPAQPYAAYNAAGTETSAGVDTIRESMGNEAFQRFMERSPTFRHMALAVAENPAMASNPVVKGSMENVIRSAAGDEGVELFRAQLRREANYFGGGAKKDVRIKRPQPLSPKMSDVEIITKGEALINGEIKHFRVGSVEPEAVQRIKQKTGYDLSGYNITLQNDEVRHLLSKHGDGAVIPRAKERPIAKNEIMLTIDDLPMLSKIANNFDDVFVSTITGKNELPRLVFIKNVENHFVVVTEVRSKYGNLVPYTAFKIPRGTYSKEQIEKLLHKMQ